MRRARTGADAAPSGARRGASRRVGWKLVGAVAILLSVGPAAALTTASASPLGRTTVKQRITSDRGAGFRFLTTVPGSRYAVRSGKRLGRARKGRAQRRISLSYFGQLTDFQVTDEESPARLEFLDPLDGFTSPWRPNEAFTPFEANEMIRQLNRFVNRPPQRPGRGRGPRMDFVVNTGDLSDNNQLNEARWNLELMEGGTVNPGSGVDPAPYLGRHPLCPAGLAAGLDSIDPAAYAGVQDRKLWPAPTMGYFWDPDEPDPIPNPANPGFLNEYAGAPAWPGLMNRAQRPFRATGLKVPGYVAFGNHDSLFQGGIYSRRLFNRTATGCLKPVNDAPVNSGRSTDPLRELRFNPDFDVDDLLALYQSDPDYFMAVPPDPARRMITKREFINLFRSRRDRKSGHGFGLVDRAERRASRGYAGYYSFSPRPRVRFVVLDTTSAGTRNRGSYQGNIDNPQFRWFERTLRRASRKNQLVIVFSHHAIPDLTAAGRDELAPPCSVVGPRKVPGCDGDPRRSTPIRLAADARRLMLRFPNAIAWIAGHSHVNRIDSYARRNGRSGFWSIQTSSLVDWPKQNRLFQLFDNRDGTLSLFGTLIDHAAPVAVPRPGRGAATFTNGQLAAIGRTVGYNDTQNGARACPAGSCRNNSVKGRANRRSDRNVELLLRDPRQGARFR